MKLKNAWICDIDGTVALMGDRGPFDWSRVGEDLPNEPVIRVVRALIYQGDGIIFMSGRMEQARKQTELWLDVNIGKVFEFTDLREWDGPFMRADGDYRPDTIVKRELYNAHILGKYHVLGAIDDRPSVIRMWASIPLFVMSVNPTCEEF